MASVVDDITIKYEEDGVVTVNELDKVILTKGAWATVIFKYQDWNKKDQAYGPAKFTIRRYQKRNNEYFQKSKFNISSIDQANKIITALTNWIENEKDESEAG
ncbi:hypothetical protein CC99x_006370 [Candidatus Berkiella cookevillensis]|uniref:Uncharacterized protein n=1 Tax=Candidatus Berkiella cookevillensis TaxID=437022 RepID=A0A0Q9YH48_9GAMM|nr:hypothetical protein [Candidatus Berkiella cookevillensis]MCS5708531.1 hypothetical protein [Candidatus Berkiella cookevillensis]